MAADGYTHTKLNKPTKFVWLAWFARALIKMRLASLGADP